MYRENEGLLAVRKRLRIEIVTLQDEEDELRRALGLPPARAELVRPSPSPLPSPPAGSRPRRKGASSKKWSRVATPPAPPPPPPLQPPQPPLPPLPKLPSLPTLPTAAPSTVPSHSSRPAIERRPNAEKSSSTAVAAAATFPGAAPSPNGGGHHHGVDGLENSPTCSRLSPPMPGSPVGSFGSFEAEPGEHDDIEKLLLGLHEDTATVQGRSGDASITPGALPPAPPQRTVGSVPQPAAGRGRGGPGRAPARGARGQRQARGSGRGPAAGAAPARGGTVLGGGRGRGVKRKPNYLDLNAAVKHRPAGRGVGRAATRGRIGSRGGRGGGRGPPAVENGRGGRGGGLRGQQLGGGSAAGIVGDGGFSQRGSRDDRGRGGGRGGVISSPTWSRGGLPVVREIGGGAQSQPQGEKETTASRNSVVAKVSRGASGGERPPGL